MSNGRLRIYKGADKSFLIRLKSRKTEDPYSLDDVTSIKVIFTNSDRTRLVLSTNVTPATRAVGELNGVVFNSQDYGAEGNNIHLIFNGVDTIAEVVSAWNGANPNTLVAHNAQDATVVFSPSEVQLNNGYDAYTPVQVYGEPKLGKVLVTMLEKETAKLRNGSNSSFSIIIDKGMNVGGNRNMGFFEQKVDVSELPV